MHDTHTLTHPLEEPPSRQRNGAPSQSQPEPVHDIRLQEGMLFVEACMGLAAAAAAVPGGGEGWALLSKIFS